MCGSLKQRENGAKIWSDGWIPFSVLSSVLWWGINQNAVDTIHRVKSFRKAFCSAFASCVPMS